jgi:rubrerythrin
MRRPSISAALRNAVLLVMAEACGQSIQTGSPDASDEAQPSDAPTTDETTNFPDGGDPDAGDLDAIDPIDVPLLPLPDGCVVSGKPDGFAPCGYTENLNDYNACQIDHDANTQEASVCFVLCDPTEPDCIYYDLGDSGGSILTCGPGCIGRLRRDARDDHETCAPLREGVGDFLARAASLEAASIDAFRVLAAELDHHGAPRLARAARRAAKDEVRHARTMARLSRARSTRTSRRVSTNERHSPRSILAIAMENAEEGCVRETFGAALAMWQAENARDADVRDAMREIARDETAHAEIGWAIAAWARSRLSARDRARVDAARTNAITAMRRDLAPTLDDDARVALGLPDLVHARALFDAVFAAY